MKKSLLALSVLGAFCCTANAQQVTIYGTFDIAAYYAQNQLSQDPNVVAPAVPQVSKYANGSVVGLANGGLSQSRIGFKGSEDLGNGLSALFVLEDRFNPNNGTIANGVASVADLGSSKNPLTSGGDSTANGQLFNGLSYVGFSSPTMGTLTFGRVNVFGSDAVSLLDPMKGSLMFSPLGYSGQYAGGGFTEDSRADNTIRYTNQTGAFNYGFLYTFGGQSGATSAQTGVSLELGYSNGPLNVMAVYARNNDAASAGAPAVPAATPQLGVGKIALTFADTEGEMIGATYQLDKFKLIAGFENMTYNTPSNPAHDAATTDWFGYPVYSVSTTTYANERKQTMTWLGTTYSASANLDLTGAFYIAHQNDYSGGLCATSNTAAATCSGNNKYLSMLADYKFSKMTDVYAGYIFNKVSGGYDPVGTIHDTNNFFAAGMRHNF